MWFSQLSRLSFRGNGPLKPIRIQSWLLIKGLNKDGNISTNRHVDSNRFSDALAGKVLSQPLPELARVVADDVVLDGAVAGRTVEYLHANLMLGDFTAVTLDDLSNDKKKKLG